MQHPDKGVMFKLPLRTDAGNGCAEDILNASGDRIADCWSGTHFDLEEARDTAAEIVRRVNLHDELVGYIRAALPRIEYLDDCGPPGYGWQSAELMALVENMKNILAKVEKEGV